MDYNTLNYAKELALTTPLRLAPNNREFNEEPRHETLIDSAYLKQPEVVIKASEAFHKLFYVEIPRRSQERRNEAEE